MAIDEEYLDNLLKNFEEEEKARETQNRQEKRSVTDMDENSVSEENKEEEDTAPEDIIFDDAVSESFAPEASTNEDWKMDLDELMSAAVENVDESDNMLTEDGLAENVSPEEILSEDVDVTQYIDGLSGTDESLAEISELLKKSDNNEAVDIFDAQEQEIQELTQEVIPEKKKRAFPWKKKKRAFPWKKKSGEQDKQEDIGVSNSEDSAFWQSLEATEQFEQSEVENDISVSENGKKDKKSSNRFGNFMQALFEEEEEAAEGESDGSSDVSEMLSGPDEEKEEKKGKKKKEKKKKDKKKKTEEEAESGAEEEEGEESGKGKKKRKKKEKKKKEKPEGAEPVKEKPKKVLSRKSLMVLIAFCASLIAVIVCLSAFLPDYIDKKQAREAFYQGNYEEAYVLLYGKNLNASDTLILNRVSVVLQMERNVEAYYFHQEEGEEAKALNALFAGVRQYNEAEDKDEFGAGDEVRSSYQKILDILNQQYAIDESQALEIIACDDVRYSEKIYAIVEGTDIAGSEEKEEEPAGPQDILPEEEDIIELDAGNEGA